MSSTLLSTTSIESLTRSTVCWRVMTPARARGAAPKTEVATAGPPLSPPFSNQSTKPRTPACRIIPTQERSSALSSRNHGRSSAIRVVAAVLSPPIARRRSSATLLRGSTARRLMR
jgi:hypothetical protein